VVDRAFGELSTEGNTTDAIVVVSGGAVVLERYNNLRPDEAHNSWSVAKSINSALVGVLVGEGRLDIWDPVDAPEWSQPDDPRAEITLDQLLRMSSGLQWEESYTDPDSDVLTTLGGGGDRAHYAADKPLADPPDTEWYYSTGTANLISRSVAEEVGYGDQLTEWADEALFSPLGITTVEHSLDDQGLISGGSWINMSALDFARFGLLYARGGVWDGTRIVPEGWVDYSRMPTPTMRKGAYGAQWWLDPERPDMFYASGFNGQSISVVPSEDLVVVVLSTRTDGKDEVVQNALLDAFGA
jgi:CubicO group peptidase (beta-lactamase class C family)